MFSFARRNDYAGIRVEILRPRSEREREKDKGRGREIGREITRGKCTRTDFRIRVAIFPPFGIII